MKTKSIKLVNLILIAVLALLSGCGESSAPVAASPTAAPADEVVIGLVLSNLANPFFVSIQEGAEEAARRVAASIEIKDAADNAETQAAQVQELIDQQVDALLINPVDGTAIVQSIEAANAAGIPVFTIDRSASGGEIVAHIASDNVAGGRMAANYLAEILDEQGAVVELEGLAGTSAAAERGAGFNEVIANYPNITIVARESANFNRVDGKAVFANILAEQSDIAAVFAHNDDMVLGAIEAAQEANRADDILFVGFDAIDEAIAALETNALAATIAQQPAEMGRLGVEMVMKQLNGETLPDYIPVDLALVTN